MFDNRPTPEQREFLDLIRRIEASADRVENLIDLLTEAEIRARRQANLQSIGFTEAEAERLSLVSFRPITTEDRP